MIGKPISSKLGSSAALAPEPTVVDAAMAATKRALWGALEAGLTAASRSGAMEMVSMWGHPDQLEGPVAFAGRREPQWATSEKEIG